MQRGALKWSRTRTPNEIQRERFPLMTLPVFLSVQLKDSGSNRNEALEGSGLAHLAGRYFASWRFTSSLSESLARLFHSDGSF